MILGQRNDPVQTFAPNRANQPFAERIAKIAPDSVVKSSRTDFLRSTGTEFNFLNDVAHFDTYLASVRKFAAIAAAAGATIIMGNQSQFDNAAPKLRMLADRRPTEPHPLEVGAAAMARYFKIEDECAQAVRLKLLATQRK